MNLETFVDRIYEAAAVPELWPGVLDDLSHIGGMSHCILFSLAKGEWRWVAAEKSVRITEEYLQEGWRQNERTDRLFNARHAGFVGDLDVYTRDEWESTSVHRDFFRVRGLGWGVATVIPIPTGDILLFALEGEYARGPVEREAIQRLDALRPHLARAGLLSCRLAFERARAAVLAFDHLGVPAALIGHHHRIMAANPKFEDLLKAGIVQDRSHRIALSDRSADALLADALRQLSTQAPNSLVRSVPVAAGEERPPVIVHLVPIRLAANDIFSGVSAICVVTPVVRAEVPTAEVVQGLFDLTPAESRIARFIAEGETVETIAATLGRSEKTIRTQLKFVFEKTGVTRQTDLALLLTGLSIPIR